MSWEAVRFDMPLAEPPRLRTIAVAGHPEGLWPYKLNFWCLHLFATPGDLSIDGVEFPIRPGCASITPRQGQLVYRFDVRPRYVYAHYDLPAEGSRTPLTPVLAMHDLGGDFSAYWSAMEEAVGAFSTQRRRAEARLWELLWKLSERRAPAEAGGPSAEGHPAMRRAREHIERNLHQPLSVANLAARVGLSHNHLTRLFREQTGETVVSYIRARRLERARHLLLHTSQPIKAIAAEVGLPDLHQFNKVVRAALGASPRALRAVKPD
ncbi:MAG: helix-turn-helix transcriptional regulator [Planctomycetes bacterium]|nr:helix-turn-helix transcriptional regulator [Planctomycetota bacterium]